MRNMSTGKKRAGRLDETRQTGNRQTENTGISAQGIIGEMERGGDKHKTGETDQGVTLPPLWGCYLAS
jgi:hypothetical protein